MLFADKISKLNARVQELEGQHNADAGNVIALTGEKADLTRQLGEATARLEGAVTAEAHQAALDEKLGEITRLNGLLDSAKSDVDKKVVEGIAKTGFAAIHRDPKATENPAKPEGKRTGTPRERLAAGTRVDNGSAK